MPFAPGTKGAIRARFVEMPAIDPDDAPNGSIFNDSTNSNAFANKSTGGDTTPVGEASASNVLLKAMQNLSGVSIAAGKPVAKRANGSIVAADSDDATTQVVIGIAAETIAHNAQGNVALIGPNVVGAITGLGFAPGAAIYLGEAGEYIDDLADLTGDNDSIIRVGYADCAAGAASATATDLILFAEVIARPEP